MKEYGSCWKGFNWSKFIQSTKSCLYKTFCFPCSTTFTHIRIFYFAFYGALGSILPFLSLYFKQNGLTPMQIGWVSGIKPIMTLIGAPMWGAIGDGYQISRWLLLGSLASWVIVYSSLIFIPSPKESFKCAVWDHPDFTNSPQQQQMMMMSNNTNITILSNLSSSITNTNTYSSLSLEKNNHYKDQSLSQPPANSSSTENLTKTTTSSSSSLSSMSRSSSKASTSTYQSAAPQHPYWILYNSNTSEIQLVKDKVPGSTQDELDQLNETIHQKVLVSSDESLWWLYHQADRKKVFIMVLMITVTGELFTSPASALADAGTSQTLGAANMEYFGVQRAWGPVGFAVSSALVGFLISKSRSPRWFCGIKVYFSSYSVMIYSLIFFIIISAISAAQMKFHEHKIKDPEKASIIDKQPQQSVLVAQGRHTTLYVIKGFANIYYGSWLLTAIYAGLCNGVVSGFLYWHMDNLGADQFLIGMASVTVSITEFVAFFFVRSVVRCVGHKGVIYISLLLYATRFVIYAVVNNPSYILIAEVFRGIGYSSIWVSLITHTSEILPESCFATLQGIILGLHLGLGSGTGQLIGGTLVHFVGARNTFYIFAVTTVAFLVLFALSQELSTKPVSDYERFENEEESSH